MTQLFKESTRFQKVLLASFFLFCLIAARGIVFAEYTPPTCPPPGCNTNAPLNVGPDQQFKIGNLILHNSTTLDSTLVSDVLLVRGGAAINELGSPIGLLVQYGNVGIGLGTSTPQAKLDVNGTVNSRGNLTVGTSTGATSTLTVYGDVIISDTPVGSPSGYLYIRIGRRAQPDSIPPFTGTDPDFSWWQQVWPSIFGGKTWNQVKMTSAKTNGACEDADLFETDDCPDDSYVATDAAPVSNRLYELRAFKQGNRWTVEHYEFVKVWTSRREGSLTVNNINSQKISGGYVDSYHITAESMSARKISALTSLEVGGDISVKGNLTASKLCVAGGSCFTSSTLLGLWQKSTSTGYTDAAYYNDGRVGIGTDTPGSNLHVSNNSSTVRVAVENTRVGGRTVLSLANNTNQWSLTTGASGSNSLTFGNDSSSKFPLTLTRDGLVGIGTTVPTGILDVVGNGDIRLKPNSLSGKVLIGENGLVDTVINGNLSLNLQGGGLRYSPGADYTNIGNNVEYSFAVNPATLSGADAWDAQYTSNRLSSCDTTLGGSECLSSPSWPANGSDPAVKYDLYAFQSAGPAGLCGVPPNPSANPSCKWKKAAKAYNKASGSGGNLSARNGSFSENIRVGNNMIIGTSKPGFLTALAEANLDPYGLSVSGKVNIGSIVAPPGKSLNVIGGVFTDQICLGDVSAGNCITSWPTFTAPTSTPSAWQSDPLGIKYSAGNVGIGGAASHIPLTIQGNPNAWIQLRDGNGGTNNWHLTGFGGGFKIVQSAIATRLAIKENGYIGIGTENPRSQLDIGGGTLSGPTRINFDNPGDGKVWLDAKGSSQDFVFAFNGSEAARISTNGTTGDLRVNQVRADKLCDISGANCLSNSDLSSGYQKFPSGLIIQWGTVTVRGSWNNTNFPTPFSPTGSYSVTVTGESASQDAVPAVEQMNNRTFRVKSDGQTFPARWIAIGY